MRLSVIFALLFSFSLASAEPFRGEPRPWTGYVITGSAPRAPRDGLVIPEHRILYLNRDGGYYEEGTADNPVNNVTTIDGVNGNLPAFHLGDEEWEEVVECVKDLYAPFAVEVTDIEPAEDVDYYEAVVGGLPGDLGLDSGIGGISSQAPGCMPMDRNINFTFSEVWGENTRDICETIAQESGHGFGMDHEYYCPDPMTYLYGCGNKEFRDFDAECGEYEPRTCNCGTTTQNSYQHLLTYTGPSDDVPPEVSITSPEDNAAVTNEFEIEATASDDIRVDRVELYIDGSLVATDEEESYSFVAPVDLAVGMHTVSVRAVDGDENGTEASITVTLVPQCEGDSDCTSGPAVCVDNRCMGDTGFVCDFHAECVSGLCYVDQEEELSICTESCQSAADCPEGYDCTEPSSGTAKCLPAAEEDGGWCSAALGRRGSSTGTGAMVLLLVFIAYFIPRRGGASSRNASTSTRGIRRSR